MTIRDHLNRKLKALYLRIAFCLGLIVTGLVFEFRHPLLTLTAFISFAVLAVTTYQLRFGIRCPRCQSSLVWLRMTTWDWAWRISWKVKSCPYCDLDFDARFAEAGLPPP